MFKRSVKPQGLIAIFLEFIIFHIIYYYTIKGGIDEKNKVLIFVDSMLIELITQLTKKNLKTLGKRWHNVIFGCENVVI